MGRSSDRISRRSTSTFEWDIKLNLTRIQRISMYFQEIADIKRLIYRRPYRGPSKVYKESDLLFDQWLAY